MHDADETAQRMLDQLIPKMAKDADVTEEMKTSDPMRWIGMMNTIKAQLEEIIFDEVIYR
ncbi:MAG: TnpV protein [Christensenellales bacterium]